MIGPLVEILSTASRAWTDGLGDAVGWILITVLAGVGTLAVAAYRTHDRSKGNEQSIETLEEDVTELDDRVGGVEEDVDEQRRYLLGDTNDPGQDGVLTELHTVKGDINRLDEKMEEQHQDVSEKLDRITDSLDDEAVEAD